MIKSTISLLFFLFVLVRTDRINQTRNQPTMPQQLTSVQNAQMMQPPPQQQQQQQPTPSSNQYNGNSSYNPQPTNY